MELYSIKDILWFKTRIFLWIIQYSCNYIVLIFKELLFSILLQKQISYSLAFYVRFPSPIQIGSLGIIRLFKSL